MTGTVFLDANENRIRDPGEAGIGGWAMFIDTHGDAVLNAGEPATTTAADGPYRFPAVAAGAATIFEIPAGGLRPTVGGLFPLAGASDRRTVSIVAGATSAADFGNLLPQVGSIQGTVHNDLDGDGATGPGEPGLAGRTVFVDLNANGAVDAGEAGQGGATVYLDLDRDGLQSPADPSAVTSAVGSYTFTRVPTGPQTVREILDPGWISAIGKGTSGTVTVTIGGIHTIDFFALVPTTGSAAPPSSTPITTACGERGSGA